MDLEAVRQLASDLDFSLVGITATVQQTPWEQPVESSVIWMGNVAEDVPVGNDYAKLGTRKLMALPRADFSKVPRKTLVTAPETVGAIPRKWQVDSVEDLTRTHFVVIVVPETP